MDVEREVRDDLVSWLRTAQAEHGLDTATLARIVAEALAEVTELPLKEQMSVSMGVVVRKGVVVPERDLHHLCWVVAERKKKSWSCTGVIAEGVLGFLALPKVGGPTISAGSYHTCVIKASGELVCFGANDEEVENEHHGQCSPPPHLGPAVAVDAGDHHTCAVKERGELVCFGLDDDGQCSPPPDLGLVAHFTAS